MSVSLCLVSALGEERVSAGETFALWLDIEAHPPSTCNRARLLMHSFFIFDSSSHEIHDLPLSYLGAVTTLPSFGEYSELP